MKKSRLLEFIENNNIAALTFMPPIIGMALLLIWAYVSNKVFNNQVPSSLHMLVTIGVFFMCGTSGLFQVLKREVPGPMGKPIRGTLAIVSGILIMILFWGMALLAIYFFLTE